MKSELVMAVNQICAEKDLSRDVILGAIEEALVHAYKRNYTSNSAPVQVRIDPDSGELHIYCEKKIVAEGMTDPEAEIGLIDAREIDPKAEVGSTLLIERAPADFGRIAAQTAKQVILQRIHEAERDALYDSFRQREGELVTGTVQSIDYRTNQVTVSLGKKAEGILTAEDQLPNDRYRIGQSVRTLLAEIHKGTRGPQIRLSRSHRNMLRRLLEREVPEIYNGTVEIKSIAREPGQRSKVAVTASQPGVDPVGSCVGMRGTRIQNIVDELNGEKIDIVEWSSDVRQFISNALSPAKPTETILLEDNDMRTAIVIVPDRQLSLAIGKEGQNARLAAKLTGWRIDIKNQSEAATEGLNEMKRQQLQIIKTRSLESKAPEMSGDDLLSRAEWLLREKDKTAVTLEQAARLLAGVEDTRKEPETAAATSQAEQVEAMAPSSPVGEVSLPPGEESVSVAISETGPSEVELPPAEVEPAAEATTIEAERSAESGEVPIPPELGPAELVYEEMEYLDTEFEGEEGDTGAAAKSAQQKSKTPGKSRSKKRELVYDEGLGRVISRKKRKPGRSGWGDDYEGL